MPSHLSRLTGSTALLLWATLAASGPGLAQTTEARGQAATARHEMVAAANPLAVQAGLDVLHAGGGAVDAAVAVQAVLGLVEPQSSGLGGGAFLLYYDARTRRVSAFNGRETAPAGARPDMFMGPDAKPLPFVQAVLSGRSTGAPGAVAMLALAHKAHGRLPWRDLFGAAASLAEQGFIVTPRLADDINGRFPQARSADATAYFTKPDGTRYQVGDRLRNPAYAATLHRVASQGAAGLLSGPTATDIAAKVHEPPLPGTLNVEDLAAYRPSAGDALCRPFNIYVVCAPSPPGGGVGLLELLGLLEATDIASRGANDPQAWLEFVQASRLMYADRDHYVADPAFAAVPTVGLVDPSYDTARAGLISALGPEAPPPGLPPGVSPNAAARGADHTPEPGGTSDFAVVDKAGDVVSMTTTVESVFGSGRMADGFFLNNQLTDFSLSPTEPSGAPAANAVAPLKHPRSSMTPAIVLDRQGRFVAAVGSPGGNNIIVYVAKTLVALLDWNMPIQQAIALPNIVARGAMVVTETGTDPAIIAVLKAHGLSVRQDGGEGSGLHGIVRTAAGLEGGADPRREGVAKGD